MKKLFTTLAALFLLSASALLAQEREIIIEKFSDGDFISERHQFRPPMGNRHQGDRRMGGGGFMGRMHGDDRPGGKFKRIMARAEELGLSDDQMEKIKSILFDFKMRQIDQEASVKKAKLRLKSFMHENETSQEAVFNAIDDLARLKADGQKAKYMFKNKLLSVLTDKQREMLDEKSMMKKMKKERNKKRDGKRYRERQKG